jgi:hypothetical protein
MTSRSVVSSLCVGLAETVNKVGPGFLEGRAYEVAIARLHILITAHRPRAPLADRRPDP